MNRYSEIFIDGDNFFKNIFLSYEDAVYHLKGKQLIFIVYEIFIGQKVVYEPSIELSARWKVQYIFQGFRQNYAFNIAGG